MVARLILLALVALTSAACLVDYEGRTYECAYVWNDKTAAWDAGCTEVRRISLP